VVVNLEAICIAAALKQFGDDLRSKTNSGDPCTDLASLFSSPDYVARRSINRQHLAEHSDASDLAVLVVASEFLEHVLPHPCSAPASAHRVSGPHDRPGVEPALPSDVLLEQLLSNLVDLSILGDGDSRDQHDEPRQNQRNAAIDHNGLHSSDQVFRNRRLSFS